MTRDKEAARLFWLRFDDLLKTKNLQLKDVAEKSALPYPSLSGWRAKHLFPDVEAVMRLANSIECSVDSMLGTSKKNMNPRIQTIVNILEADEKQLCALEALWGLDKKAGSSGVMVS